MSALINEEVAKKVARFFRMLSSPFKNEAHVALSKMKHLLEAEGLTFSDIAILIEQASGEIRQLKYSDDDAHTIFERGKEKGRTEAECEDEPPPEFYEIDGSPRWYEIAEFCQQNSAQQKNGVPLLSEWELDFISAMPSKMIQYRRPTPKQARFLIAIFVKLGGSYVRKSFEQYR